MTLSIAATKIQPLDDEFIKFIVEKINELLYIKSRALFKKLSNFDNLILECTANEFDTTQLIKLAAKNIIYTKNYKNFYITINTAVKINNISLLQLCKLIEYGNSQLQGTGIFTEVFNYIKNNLDTYMLQYQLLSEDT